VKVAPAGGTWREPAPTSDSVLESDSEGGEAATPGPLPSDPLRDELLDAAARVVARQGYDGTRLQDIVTEAGLSTGAVYGRFRSKHDLLREALMTRSVPRALTVPADHAQVAGMVVSWASQTRGALTDGEALLLETYVTARREPEVSDALVAAGRQWRSAVAPLVAAATHDGTIDPTLDPAAVLFLVHVLRLGLLVYRGSGLPVPPAHGWTELIERIVASFGTDQPTGTHQPTDRPAPTTMNG